MRPIILLCAFTAALAIPHGEIMKTKDKSPTSVVTGPNGSNIVATNYPGKVETISTKSETPSGKKTVSEKTVISGPSSISTVIGPEALKKSSDNENGPAGYFSKPEISNPEKVSLFHYPEKQNNLNPVTNEGIIGPLYPWGAAAGRPPIYINEKDGSLVDIKPGIVQPEPYSQGDSSLEVNKPPKKPCHHQEVTPLNLENQVALSLNLLENFMQILISSFIQTVQIINQNPLSLLNSGSTIPCLQHLQKPLVDLLNLQQIHNINTESNIQNTNIQDVILNLLQIQKPNANNINQLLQSILLQHELVHHHNVPNLHGKLNIIQQMPWLLQFERPNLLQILLGNLLKPVLGGLLQPPVQTIPIIPQPAPQLLHQQSMQSTAFQDLRPSPFDAVLNQLVNQVPLQIPSGISQQQSNIYQQQLQKPTELHQQKGPSNLNAQQGYYYGYEFPSVDPYDAPYIQTEDGIIFPRSTARRNAKQEKERRKLFN